MTRDESAPPVLAPLAAAQLDSAWDLTQALSWPHRREDWQLMHALGAGVGARLGERLVGTAMWWPCGDNAATLGMVIVDATCRGRGLGRKLMDHALAALDTRGVMLNATAVGMPLYLATGFAVVGEIEQHQAVLETPPIGDAPPTEIRRAMPTDAEAIRALDAQAFLAPRDALIARLLVEAEFLVATQDDTVIGFACRRRFGRGALIGPLAATDEATACALVGVWLARSTGFVRIDVPADATELTRLMRRAGLARVDTVTTMRRGAGWNAPSRARVFALASQAFG